MKKHFPYLLVTLAFGLLLLVRYPGIFRYQFSQNTVRDYLRSQDIEDPNGLIKDRIIMSDSDTYAATGYLYAKGEDPTKYNFQHPPLIKYFFGASILLTGNPYWVQILFGLTFLFLTYFLGTHVFKNRTLAFIPILLLLIDPLFGSMMSETLLDPGHAVFAVSYITLMLFYPERYILSGVILGLFIASKFWSTAVIFVVLVYLYKIFLRKEKLNYKKVFIGFLVAFVTFSSTYVVSFTQGFIQHQAGGAGFNIFFFLMKDLKYMLAHDSAGVFGGTILLFLKGYILWPLSLLAGIYMVFRTKIKDVRFFLLALPVIYLLSLGAALPFTRYFLIILPFLYINLVSIIKLIL